MFNRTRNNLRFARNSKHETKSLLASRWVAAVCHQDLRQSSEGSTENGRNIKKLMNQGLHGCGCFLGIMVDEVRLGQKLADSCLAAALGISAITSRALTRTLLSSASPVPFSHRSSCTAACASSLACLHAFEVPRSSQICAFLLFPCVTPHARCIMAVKGCWTCKGQPC
jgi:ABC-type enterobactin transport system permease subunit